jgi:NAD-dependent DNA ligase
VCMSEDVVRCKDGPLRDEERELMAHRYLYYILAEPVITDYQYDMREKAFRDKIGEDSKSPIMLPGSSLESSYTAEEVTTAFYLQSVNG